MYDVIMKPTKEKVLNGTKPFRLTKSEIDRAEVGYNSNLKYTIVRRPQPDGTILVAAVNVDTGLAQEAEVAENKEDVRRAFYVVNRQLDKMGRGGKMSHKSRHRWNKKLSDKEKT